MQRSCLLVDNNELDLLADLHTQADLGERCAPVGWQFSLLIVKPGLTSWKVIGVLVTPKPRAVMESFLKYKQEPLALHYTHNFRMPGQSFYLCAINLHGQRPPSISASKVSHVTVNRNLLRTKLQRVHLAFGRTTKMKIVTVRFISPKIIFAFLDYSCSFLTVRQNIEDQRFKAVFEKEKDSVSWR